MLIFQEMFNYGLVSSPLIETTALEVRKLQPGSRHFSQVRKWRLKTGRDLVKIHNLRQIDGQNAFLLQVQSRSNTPLKSNAPLKSDCHILYFTWKTCGFPVFQTGSCSSTKVSSRKEGKHLKCHCLFARQLVSFRSLDYESWQT